MPGGFLLVEMHPTERTECMELLNSKKPLVMRMANSEKPLVMRLANSKEPDRHAKKYFIAAEKRACVGRDEKIFNGKALSMKNGHFSRVYL